MPCQQVTDKQLQQTRLLLRGQFHARAARAAALSYESYGALRSSLASSGSAASSRRRLSSSDGSCGPSHRSGKQRRQQQWQQQMCISAARTRYSVLRVRVRGRHCERVAARLVVSSCSVLAFYPATTMVLLLGEGTQSINQVDELN
jgi:hypothetical protein